MYDVFLLKNGQLTKAAEIDTPLNPGDLIRHNAKFYRVAYRVFELKTDNTKFTLIVEEFNPLQP